MRWDIFCQIVDNYGDAGVCWRLARALSKISSRSGADGDDIRIRLFCDDLKVLNAMAHGDAVSQAASFGIEVLPWSTAESPGVLSSVGNVVIEAFACELPSAYVSALATSTTQPIWINLEYLTAEAWADEMHLMPSPQNNGLLKHFYFPGFTAGTGGVILGDEAILRSADAPPASPLSSLQANAPDSLKSALGHCRDGAKRISVFHYPTAPLDAWLTSLNEAASSHDEVVDVLVCASQNIAALKEASLGVIDSGALRLIQLPFIPQEDYDWLVSHCDMNLVRGEDSFVRTQWAGKPFIWDIYPQSDLAHEVKLDAFLDRYFATSTPEFRTLGQSAMKWGPVTEWWPHWTAWTEHSKAWAKKLVALGHLEGKILDFVKSQEISR